MVTSSERCWNERERSKRLIRKRSANGTRRKCKLRNSSLLVIEILDLRLRRRLGTGACEALPYFGACESRAAKVSG